MVKTNLLKAAYDRHRTSAKLVAKAIGISEQQLSKIANNKAGCDINRSIEIANAIGLSRDEYIEIFLPDSFTA